MSPCLETFRHDSIYPGFFAFLGEQRAADHVYDCDPVGFERGSPFLGTPGRGEYDFHPFLNNDIHETVNFRVE